MSASKFTPEEIRLLKEHPYIIEVTPGKVCFSKEFKEIIIRKEGKSGNGFRDTHSLNYKNNGFKSPEDEPRGQFAQRKVAL